MLKKNQSITLDKFIDYCLYDKKNGYYINKNPFGVTGDFITAPNISRLYSEMLAIWTISFWESLGCPKKFNLIELGAGNGEMMRIMIESFKKFPSFFYSCNILIHEKSPKLIKIQREKIKSKTIRWIKNLKKSYKFPTIFIANEFFDAMPIKQFVKEKNYWYERVIKNFNNKLILEKKKIDIKNLEKKANFKISKKQDFIEYSPKGIKYLTEIIKIIDKDTGGLLIIDYGSYEIKFKNTIKAIYKQKSSNFLKNIGKSDITHHINYNLFNTVVKNFKGLTSNYTTQKKFLSNLGIFHRAEILSKNKTFSQKADIFYRVKRLIDENQMGNLFKVMLIKNIKNKSKVGF